MGFGSEVGAKKPSRTFQLTVMAFPLPCPNDKRFMLLPNCDTTAAPITLFWERRLEKTGLERGRERERETESNFVTS